MEKINEYGDNPLCIENSLNKLESSYSNSFEYNVSESLLSALKQKTVQSNMKGLLYCSIKEKQVFINEFSEFDFDKSEESLFNHINFESSYLAECRRSFTPIGLMLVSSKLNIDKSLINKLLEFEVYCPNSIFLFYSTIEKKASIYKLTLKSIKNSFLSKTVNIRPEEYMIDLYNNSYMSDFIKEYPFSIKKDLVEIFGSLNKEKYENENNKYGLTDIENKDLQEQHQM